MEKHQEKLSWKKLQEMRSGCSLSEADFEPKEMHFISQAGGSNWALEEKLLSADRLF